MKVDYKKIENIYIGELEVGDFFINNENIYVVTNRFFYNYAKALRLKDYISCVFSFGSVVQKIEVKSIDS